MGIAEILGSAIALGIVTFVFMSDRKSEKLRKERRQQDDERRAKNVQRAREAAQKEVVKRQHEREALRLQEEEFAKAEMQRDIQNQAIAEAENKLQRGAIFEVTTDSAVMGYHLRELGWVSCEADARSIAEKELVLAAAKKFDTANMLTKLSKQGTGQVWEARVCEAIPTELVDANVPLRDESIVVIDGSNVVKWDASVPANLNAVRKVLELLDKEGKQAIVVFDANIAFELTGKRQPFQYFRDQLGDAHKIEIVPSGTNADRRIIELADEKNGIIISNDFFRDSLRARQIPKRRGGYIAEFDFLHLTACRPSKTKAI